MHLLFHFICQGFMHHSEPGGKQQVSRMACLSPEGCWLKWGITLGGMLNGTHIKHISKYNIYTYIYIYRYIAYMCKQNRNG